jgi:MurNAc alpha-1-phosphate uridylyltransferase
MRAMILAAGAGERMRPLTDTTPKPLLKIGGKPIIEYHLEALSQAGFREIVINQGHLGEQLPAALGDGARWGVNIHWSVEPPSALETGGGIHQALPLLGNAPFLAVNGDIRTDYPFARLRAVKCDHAHLVMVDNPPHNPQGDFSLQGAILKPEGPGKLTYAGIAVYHPRLFANCEPGRYSVVPLLLEAMHNHIVTGERHAGLWSDIGTPERLEEINAAL